MADKRRSSPGTTMSLKAHAFSVEALIGAEKQQQPPPRQPKRRKLGGEDEAPEDEGVSGCCAKSSPAAGRTCGDMELGCAARAPAGECCPATRRRAAARARLSPRLPDGRPAPPPWRRLPPCPTPQPALSFPVIPSVFPYCMGTLHSPHSPLSLPAAPRTSRRRCLLKLRGLAGPRATARMRAAAGELGGAAAPWSSSWALVSEEGARRAYNAQVCVHCWKRT